MAPATQRDRSEKYLASNTRFGSQNLTTVSRVLEIIMVVMFTPYPIRVMERDRGVERGVLLALIRRTQLSREAFGNRSGSPETLWLIF